MKVRTSILRNDPDQRILEAPLHKVKFRIKIEAGDHQCKFVPMIKFKIFWFIWSDWYFMGIEGGNQIKFGDRCLNRHCSMQSAQDTVASAKLIFMYSYATYQREAVETAYHEA